jgi:lipid-A-disaccharide synthase
MAKNGTFDTLQHCLRSPVFFCAGEPSGDLYAALLAGYFRREAPHVRMYGVGGPAMQGAGITVLKPYSDMQVFGFNAALRSLSASIRAYQDIASLLRTIRPGTFIPVAYPGLNLLLCRHAKRLGARVCYFMPPQIWAWGKFRTYFVRRWVDTVISVFPFEHHLYRTLGVNALLVKNPLEKMLRKYHRIGRSPCIGFMPGSRVRDARRHLPIMSRVAAQVLGSRPDVRCVFIVPHENGLLHAAAQNAADMINRQGNEERALVKTVNRYALMKNCDLLIISSGTASLEAFIMRIPQIFVHRPSFIDYYFLKPFLSIDEYNLVNLMCGEKLVPTCIRRDPEAIAHFIQQHIVHDLRD